MTENALFMRRKQQKFRVEKILDPKNSWYKKIVGSKKLGPKKSWSKIIVGPEKFLVLKNFWSKKTWGQKNWGSKKI